MEGCTDERSGEDCGASGWTSEASAEDSDREGATGEGAPATEAEWQA